MTNYSDVLEVLNECDVRGMDESAEGIIEGYLLAKGWLEFVTPIFDEVDRVIAANFVLEYEPVPFAPEETGEVKDLSSEWWKLDDDSFALWERLSYLYASGMGFYCNPNYHVRPNAVSEYKDYRAKIIYHFFNEKDSWHIGLHMDELKVNQLADLMVVNYMTDVGAVDVSKLLDNLTEGIFSPL